MSLIPISLRKRFLPDRAQFRAPIRTQEGRRAAWIDLLFVDFGILRLIWKNRVQISPRAWRMNQPFPGDIRWAKARGIRTIMSARHDLRHGGYALEVEACQQLGLYFEVIPFFSREAPSREAMLEAADQLKNAAYPILIHCKSGADRAGFLSAFYAIVMEDIPVRDARKQLSLRFLHIKQSKTGILDAVFDAYLAAHPREEKPFLDWVRDEYDPAALKRAFRHGWFADVLDRVILRHE